MYRHGQFPKTKYFSLCEWVERDLILLDRIDTFINMSDHLTKPVQPLLFHQHADFLLGHVQPPSYSPVYSNIVGKYTNHTVDVNKFTPTSFTTALTAAPAQIYAPVKDDYAHSPWLQILGHGDTIQCSHDSSLLSSSFNHMLHTGLWGGCYHRIVVAKILATLSPIVSVPSGQWDAERYQLRISSQ